VIARVLAFLALLGLGFLVLWLALGREAFTAKRSQLPPAPPARSTGMGGIDVQPEREGSARLTLSIEGEFEVQPKREVALADGTKLLVPTYRLHAADTRPRPDADNLMEMRDVIVELFRLVRGDGEPRAEKSGEVTARTVLVEVERDPHGRPSIHQDRDMDFRDAVFRTLPTSGGPTSGGSTAMTLEVARVRVRTSDTEAVLRTAEREPFTLELTGAERAVLTGNGLLANFPIGDAPGPFDVRVVSEPTLTMGDGKTTARARGGLRFVEERGGPGRIELEDQVELAFGAVGRPPLTARGDRLRAGLQRTRTGTADRPGASWEWLVLQGEPVRVETTGASIDCTRLDVLPTTGGGVRLVTATGAPARVTVQPVAADGSAGQTAPTVFTSERRVHLLEVAQSLHEWLGPLGFPRGALGTRFAQLVVFVGRSTATMPQAKGTSTLEAAEGLVVLRSTRADGPITVRGHGQVTAVLPEEDVRLEGEDGMVVHDLPTAAGRTSEVTLGLGNADAPRFGLRRGPDLHLEGHGRFRLRQTVARGVSEATIDVTSPGQDVVVTSAQGTVRRVGRLRAALAAGSLVGLEASGSRCVVDAELREGPVHCEAERVVATGSSTFSLHGAPAHVVDASRGEVFGEVVDLLTFGSQTALRARGGARVLGKVARRDAAPLDVELQGQLAELLPWRVPPRALQWHASWLPAPAATVFAAAWRAPHVHATGGVTFRITDPADRDAAQGGSGDELWLQLEDGGSRALLLGNPAHAEVAAADQAADGSAESIAFRQAERTALSTLTPAAGRESTMHVRATGEPKPGGAGSLDVRALTVHCRGEIRIEERVIRFLGPVRVLGDGGDGGQTTLTLTAAGMSMRRDAAGAVTEIVAEGDVDLRSPRVHGQGDTLTLDVKKALAVLGSRTGLATVETDDGPVFRSSQLEYDYTTHAVRAWYGDVGPREGR